MSDENPGAMTAGTVVVTAVAAATGETALVRVAAGAPAATLVAELGSPVGVPVVSNLLLEDGTPIPPGSTLDAAGISDGSKVLVVGNRDRHQAGAAAVLTGVGDQGRVQAGPRVVDQVRPGEEPEPMTGFDAIMSRTWGDAPTPARPEVLSSRTISGRPDARRDSPARTRALVGGAAVLLAAALVLAGLVIGRATRSTAKVVTTPPAAALAVAAAWANATAYSGPLLPGVPSRLGRTGRLTGIIEPVGFLAVGSADDTWFVVVPASGQAFGLTVRLVGGVLAAPPAISALPFGAGALPPSSGARLAGAPVTSRTIATWAMQTFGTGAPLLGSPGVGLVGTPTVVAEWLPAAGGAVSQVRVELSSTASGTPATTASAIVTQAQAVVTADAAALAKDNAALTQANAANATAQQALAAAAAAAAANPAAVPAVAPAQATATATTQAAATAQSQVGTDQAKEKSDQAALTAAERNVPGAFRTIGTYDVWVTGDRVTGWVPSGYQGG